jgi:two-component system chemotaxis response regulator CheB
VKRHGGIAVVQDPSDAIYPGMPQSALGNLDVDFVVKLNELPELLMTLAGRIAKGVKDVIPEIPSEPTWLTCPECRGPLGEFKAGPFSEFRCRVGHVYAPATLLSAHADTLERTLWAGVVALEESAEIARQMQATLPGQAELLQREEKAKQEMANRLRGMLNDLVGRYNAEEADE